MSRTLLPLALGVVALVAPALAMMPPEAYEEARQTAPNVLVIAVDAVTTPDGAFGTCDVAGTIHTVERGTRYQAGDSLVIGVDCIREYADDIPIGGTIWQDTPELVASTFGRAYLDADGQVVFSQYQILATPTDAPL